jgi:hypothetical protein
MSVSSEVGRTLVKSPPELWTELSDPTTLARHLGELGEIRIIGTEPERIVVWEAATGDGAEVSGRVELQPSGWGTRVTLSASRSVVALEPAEIEPACEHEPEMADVIPEAEPEPEPEPEIVESESPPGFFARLFRRRRHQLTHEPAVEPEPEPEPVAVVEIEEPAPEAPTPEEPVFEESTPETEISAELAELEEQTEAVLTGVLDRLGAAHHRPFSRA